MAFDYTSQTLESHLLRMQIKTGHHKSVLKIWLELFSAKYLYSYFFQYNRRDFERNNYS